MIKQILFWQPVGSVSSQALYFFSHWFIWLVIVFLLIFWAIKKKGKILVNFLFLLAGSELIHSLLKRFSPWSRPFYDNGNLPPSWFTDYSQGSFPSGHALRSTVILYFIYQENKKLFWILLPGFVLVVLGRVVFSLHYPIDIFGGVLIGLVLIKITKNVF